MSVDSCLAPSTHTLFHNHIIISLRSIEREKMGVTTRLQEQQRRLSSSQRKADDEHEHEHHAASNVARRVASKLQRDGFDHSPVENHRSHNEEAVAAASSLRDKLSQSASYQVFLEGVTVYAACLLLPTLLGYLIRLYEDGGNGVHNMDIDNDDNSWSAYFTAHANYYLCPSTDTYAAPDSWTAMYASYMYCPDPSSATTTSAAMVWSPDTDTSDLGWIGLGALALALVRFGVVHWLVPMVIGNHDGQHWEAMVRCKSVHLLSGAYPGTMTPRAGTPVMHAGVVIPPPPAAQPARMLLPDFVNAADNNSSTNLGFSIDETDIGGDDNDDFVRMAEVPAQQAQIVENDDDDELDMDEIYDDNDLLPVTDDDGETGQGGRHHDDGDHDTRLYAAPRYATAVFRLWYCTVTVLLAWRFFAAADFWPWYVGGHGQTQQCWDLSGGLSLGVDSDFDDHNVVLRRYFLWQAAYHWHSAAFHILSILLLLQKPATTTMTTTTVTSAMGTPPKQ